ncbi:MAG: YraN family protein, partial [Candidatus Moraniibacteriota bacterium]
MLGTRTLGACYGHIFIYSASTGKRPAPTILVSGEKEGRKWLDRPFFVCQIRYFSLCCTEIALIQSQMETQNIGQAGEDAAAEYLKANGYRIRERNYANTRGLRLGEIDIVAEK